MVQKIVSNHSELYSSNLLITEFYSITASKLREGNLTEKVAREVIEYSSSKILSVTQKA